MWSKAPCSGRDRIPLKSIELSFPRMGAPSPVEEMTRLIRFWDAQRGTLMRTLSTPGGPIFALAWHPGGRLLASAGSDHQIRLWDLQAERPGENVRLLPGHTNWVIRAGFFPRWTYSGEHGFGRVCQAVGRRRSALARDACRAYRLLSSASPGVRMETSWQVAVIDQTIRLWDVERASSRAVMRGHHGTVMDTAFTSDGRYLISGGLDSTLRMWEIERSQCTRIMQSYTASLNDLSWSPGWQPGSPLSARIRW